MNDSNDDEKEDRRTPSALPGARILKDLPPASFAALELQKRLDEIGTLPLRTLPPEPPPVTRKQIADLLRKLRRREYGEWDLVLDTWENEGC